MLVYFFPIKWSKLRPCLIEILQQHQEQFGIFFAKRVKKKEQLVKWSREKPNLTIRGR
jgi:hypothetical protein